MGSLKLNFKNCYEQVGKFLGIPTLTDAADITKCKNLVYRGYRRFLMPLDLSTKPPTSYKWKFLERTSTLSIETNVDTYKMPLGFSSFVIPFTYTSSVTINPKQRSLVFIYEQKSQTSTSGYPMYFALKDGSYDEVNGQQYEVVFYPTPSSAQTFYYTYIFMPPSPVNDDDVFVGDDLASEAILECSLAAADLQENDSVGAHAAESERFTQMLIGKDKRDGLVPYLGQITSGARISYTRNVVITDQNGAQVLP